MTYAQSADASLRGKLRRRAARLAGRRPAPARLGLPMVSFTFDDAPASAAKAGAAILEARGLRGTYFIGTGLLGQDSPCGRVATGEDVARLYAAGHEIGCHTASHLNCALASREALLADLEANRKALETLGVPEPESFAYPYGDVSAAAKRALAGRYGVMRALHPGLIEAGTDLNQAPSVGIEGPDGEANARRWLDLAMARRAWLILYTHDVGQTPSPWGCEPGALERLVAQALAGGAEVVTVAEGRRRLGATGGLGAALSGSASLAASATKITQRMSL
jgi:peptidoglycan/xylan/chitin deacetylase (PgdA/CDA1 family)